MADALFIGKKNVNTITVKEMKAKIKAGVDINATNDENVTVLMVAANHTTDGILVQALLDAGADVNAQDEYGTTALMMTKETEIIKILLKAGGDVKISDDHTKSTPLIHALNNKAEFEGIQALLDAGSDVNAVNQYESTPLTVAIEEKLPEAVTQLLIDSGADVHYQEGTYHSPLRTALSEKAKVATLQILMESGVKPTEQDLNEYDITKSRIKLLEKYMDKDVLKAKAQPKSDKYWLSKKLAKTITLEQLNEKIDKGFDVNAKNKDDNNTTILMDILNNGHDIKLIETLLNAGATVNNIIENGYTELMYAMQGLQGIPVLKLLINAGADVNLSGNNEFTPLRMVKDCLTYKKNDNSLALSKKYLKFLLEEGANPNIVWGDETEDHIYAMASLLSYFAGTPAMKYSVKIMLDAGAEPNDHNGTSLALTAAVQSYSSSGTDDISVCKTLINAGAKPNKYFHGALSGHPKATQILNQLKKAE